MDLVTKMFYLQSNKYIYSDTSALKFREIKKGLDAEFGCCWNVVIGDCYTLSIDFEHFVQVLAGRR